MSAPGTLIEEFTANVDAVLTEDLTALADLSADERVDRYRELEEAEETFLEAFTGTHADFLTAAERNRLRADVRLARLFLAASFHDEGGPPARIPDEFSERERRAVVDFDRYRAFDALDSDEVADRIARMDGELYELVREYHDTQLANLDDLLESDDVHRDVLERLVDRYEERLETVRAGVFTYVEEHGLTHAVDEVEAAVRASADAAADRRAATAPLDGPAVSTDATNREAVDALDDYLGDLEERIDRLTDSLADLDGVAVGQDSDAATVVETERDRILDAKRDLDAARSRAELERDRLTEDATADAVPRVSAALARVYELDYLGRFDASMHDVETLVTPDGPVDAPTDWSGASAVRDDQTVLHDHDADPDAHPRNREVRYEVGGGGFLSFARQPALVVQVACRAHLDSFARDGFDDRPADLDDALAVVAPVVETAERNDTHHLVAVASPTGWTDRARETVTGETPRSRFGPRVSVCLVDLREGDLHYDASDAVVAENAHLFEHSLDDERVATCVDAIRTRLTDPTTTHVRLRDVTEDGFDDRVVRRAFDRLATDGFGTVVDVEDHGRCLSLD